MIPGGCMDPTQAGDMGSNHNSTEESYQDIENFGIFKQTSTATSLKDGEEEMAPGSVTDLADRGSKDDEMLQSSQESLIGLTEDSNLSMEMDLIAVIDKVRIGWL